MGESTKSTCALLMIVSAVTAALAWMDDRPDLTTWLLRICGLIVATLSLCLILTLHFRNDFEHDYLRSSFRTYFNRDGLCFAFSVTVTNGIAFIHAHFQTQYDRRSIGRIALRPARVFLIGRAGIDTITFNIDCPPAGFGVARIAFPIPKHLQGERQSFEVGAAVKYPNGKGHRIRFHDGVFLRPDTDFVDSVGSALTVASAAAGSMVRLGTVTTTIDLPLGVAEELPSTPEPESKILWQLGEPALERV